MPPNTLQDSNANVDTGHLFTSTDAGETFTDVSGNLPDVPATWVTLRGKQLIVGTDVGVFATNTKGKTEFYYLNGLPVVPISTMNLKPDDPNLLVVATYGRGIWTYCFEQPLNGTTGGCPITPVPPPAPPSAPVGEVLAGPFGFENPNDGWTVTSTDSLHVTEWKRSTTFSNSPPTSFAVSPYTQQNSTSLASPRFNHPGGWLFVDFQLRNNSEVDHCGCDVTVIEWSTDGVNWKASNWAWDPAASEWTSQTAYEGQNRSYPLFSAEKVAINAPAASTLQVRFRFVSDQLLATEGVYIDDVKVSR